MDRFAGYYSYHQLHGEIGWLTLGERFDGTRSPIAASTISPLIHLADWLEDLRAAA